METPQPERPLKRRLHAVQIASVAVVLAAVILLAASFETSSPSGPALLALILVALALAISLQARSLLAARHEHVETVKALDTTEREFKSIFKSALDGIVILDDRGICREANPAASALWGTARGELIGQRIEPRLAVVSDGNNKDFLERPSARSEAKILRRDGATVFVEYTAKSNYLPGRHLVILRDITDKKAAESALGNSEERFRQMATNIQEVFWMLDAKDQQIVYVSQAYQAITGRSCASLLEHPEAFQDLIHSEDRERVLARSGQAVQSGRFEEEFRIVRADGAVVWICVRGFPVRGTDGVLRHIVGTAQDVSARKSAEEQMIRNLELAKSARAEAEALRNASLALTENLSMDNVLDTLLHSLLELIPCDSARVLLWEADTLFFTAREMQRPGIDPPAAAHALTFDARDNRLLMRVLTTRDAVLLSDTRDEPDWQTFPGHSQFHSWLCAPLVAAQQVLGLLSIEHAQPRAFNDEHLRLARSLAIPAAVAIQNARLYERAEIYSAELEQRLADLQQAREALQEAEQAAHFRRRDS